MHHTFDCGDSFNKWTPNGWFGVFDDPALGKDFYKQYKAKPVEGEAYCNDFKELFDLKRTTKEPGLSIVVLYPKKDITERAIKKAVIQNFSTRSSIEILSLGWRMVVIRSLRVKIYTRS